MGELDALTLEICRYPKGSQERQKRLNLLIVKMQRSRQIWNAPQMPRNDYQEALQKTWLWFCQHLDRYDPTQASVMTWFNNRLKFTILHQWRRIKTENARLIQLNSSLDEENESFWENIPDPRLEPSSMLQDLHEWLQSNQQELRRIHLRNCPEANCYTLIPHRLPPQPTPWERLSQKFKVPLPTLSGFYHRECLPQLQKFAKEYGYN